MTKKLQKKNKELNKGLNKNLINIFKMIAISSDLVECAKKHCLEQKNKIMEDKETAILHKNYKSEKNIDKKLIFAQQYSENDIIYNYNKCLIKNCTKILNDLMIFLRSIINTLTIKNEERVELNKMIVELETLFKKKELTKEEFKIYNNNITILLNTIK